MFFFLRSVSSLPVLDTQPIQHTSIFLSGAVKKRLLQLPESTRCEQTIRTSLMADPYPLYIQQLSKLVEPSMEAIAELHQVLNVVNRREVNLDEIKEPDLRLRQVLASEQLEEVTEVVPAVERDPVHGVV